MSFSPSQWVLEWHSPSGARNHLETVVSSPSSCPINRVGEDKISSRPPPPPPPLIDLEKLVWPSHYPCPLLLAAGCNTAAPSSGDLWPFTTILIVNLSPRNMKWIRRIDLPVFVCVYMCVSVCEIWFFIALFSFYLLIRLV